MSMPGFPSARFRRIGLELRRLREDLGMSLKAASAILERSSSSLSLIETGLQAIRPRDLEYILLKYGIPDGPFKEAMLELARDGRKKGWWRGYAGVLAPEMMDFISLEADAKKIQTHEPLLIPGLFQTPGYARSWIRSDSAEEIERAVEIRIARQAVLSKPDPPQFNAIIGEAALRQELGGRAVMRDQLIKLGDLSELRNVSIRVLPFSTGAHRGLRGSFTLLEVGERGRLTLVTIETMRGISYVERGEEVHEFTEIFDELTAVALPESDSRTVIDRIRSEL